MSSLDFRGRMASFAQTFDRSVSNLDFRARKIMFHENLTELHAISDYKKRLYKKRLVVFVDIKKRRLVTISHAKKRNILQYFQNALSRE